MSAAIQEMRACGLFYEERDRLVAVAAPQSKGFWLDSPKQSQASPVPAIAAE
jgi:hypothetical protein